MSKELNLKLKITFSDNVSSDKDISEVIENVARSIENEIDVGMGIAPEDSDALTDAIEITDETGQLVGRKNFVLKLFPTMTVETFLNSYCTKVSDTNDSETDVYMDNHICVDYKGTQWYVPKDNILYDNQDESVYEYLKENYEL